MNGAANKSFWTVDGPLANTDRWYKTARAAHKACDRLDLKYGASVHCVTRCVESPNEKSPSAGEC